MAGGRSCMLMLGRKGWQRGRPSILVGERCRAGGNSLLNGGIDGDTVVGALGCGGLGSCSFASDASRGLPRQMTGHWLLMIGWASAGCRLPAWRRHGGRCSDQGTAEVSARLARGLRSLNSSPVSLPGRRRLVHLALQEGGLLLQSISWWPWRAAVAAG